MKESFFFEGDSEGAEFAQEMKESFFSRDSEGAFGMESATPQTP